MNYSKKTLISVGVALIIVCVGVNSITLLDLSIKSVSIPVAGVVSDIKDKFRDISRYFRRVDYYISENQALRSEIKRLSSSQIPQSAYKLKIQKLNQLLKIKGNYENNNYRAVAAEVISIDFNNWGDTFKLDKGADDKISAGDYVMDVDGLAGKVTDVGKGYSIVSYITNPLSNIAARVRRNNILGVVSGTAQHGCMLRVFGNTDDVNVGDFVETTDKGGILVGEVSGMYVDNGEVCFKINPVVDFSKLKEVLVLNED